MTIESFRENVAYDVQIENGRAVSCTCPDHVFRQRECKHMRSTNELLSSGDDPLVSRIVGGRLVACRWSQLSQDEKRACYANYEASLGIM